MSSSQQIESVWSEFCDRLKEAGRELNRSTTPEDDVTVAEGLRYLSRLTRLALTNHIEHGDPLFPSLNQIVSETEKFGCDNPDTIYQTAALDPHSSYRLFGERGTVNYLSFLTTGGAHGSYVRDGFLDVTQLSIDEDGSFEIVISADEHPGNWLPMSKASNSLTVRQTFLDRASERPAKLQIERLGADADINVLTPHVMEAKLAAASQFIQYCTKTFTDWSESYLPHVNELPPSDQSVLIAAGLDPNIFFYRSCWQVHPEQALIIHVPRVPDCETWNIQVDNYWQESMDYRYFKSHINKHTAVLNPDGSLTAVIAHSDTGHPNWLNTVGHVNGHLGMRYVGAGENASTATARPTTKLCTLEELDRCIQQLEER